MNKNNGKEIFFIEWLSSSRSNTWMVLLIFFMCIGVLVFIFSSYLYIQINNDSIFIVNNNQQGGISFKEIDKDNLNKIINSFEEKSKEFESLKEQKTTNIVDPSL